MFPLLAAVHTKELTTIVPAIAAGAGAVYALLPRPKPYPTWIGALLGGAALLFTGSTILRTGAVTPETFLFYAFSLLAIVSGVLLVTQHNPARAALAFAVVVLSTCGLFLLLAAPFLAAASIIIYAGAIIVTFLFVLMLAQQAGLGDADARSREPLLATITGFVLLGALVYVLQLSYENNPLLKQTDELLVQTRQAKASLSSQPVPMEPLENLNIALDHALDSKQEWSRLGDRQGITPLRGDIANLLLKDLTLPEYQDKLKKDLDELEIALLRARDQSTWVVLSNHHQATISDMSGPSVSEPGSNLRYDAQGRPQMPGDNPAFLGRSLFTDYLLPVELGGFLLLVAVIGSIAIAHRRTSSERPA